MREPDSATSNYGWALWHLEMAEASVTMEGASAHARLAQARATLALVDQTGAAQGHFPPMQTTWSEPEVKE